MSDNNPQKITAAEINWKQGTPESVKFKDIYFNPGAGMAESRHVFIEGIGGADLWADKDCFTVGETGFGSGLNFLTLWQLWDKTRKEGQRLHFLSVEAFPLTPQDIEKALSIRPELAPYTKKLCQAYPELHPGIHRITFGADQVTLSLLFGTADEMLPQIRGYIDAWFLDGFAPSRNKSMWNDKLYGEIARLSKPGAKLASFTAASHVRRGLAAAGFDISKRPGFGKKRECITGILVRKKPTAADKKHPWFTPPVALSTGKKIALIGGGIAGFMTSEALSNRGFMPHIFEAAPQAGAVGSGNLIALVQPRLTAADSLDGRFNATAFLHALRHYSGQTGYRGKYLWLAKRGVLQLARNEEENKRFLRLVQETRLPEKVMQFVSAGEASRLAHTPIQQNALYFPSAGCVSPRDIVTEFAKNHANFFPDHQIRALEKREAGWLLHGLAEGEDFISEKYAAVILANGPHCKQIWPDWELPIHAKRGQVVHYKATPESKNLNCSIAFEGYISPAAKLTIKDRLCNIHVAGASYADLTENPPVESKNHPAPWRILCKQDHLVLKENLDKYLHDLGLDAEMDLFPGRAGLRATVPDHLAVMGPLPVYDFFEKTYADLHHGKPAYLYRGAKYHEGLYCLTGLGSRGIQTAPLLAEALADLITGEPCALAKDQLDALHPARFHIRKLKRALKAAR